MSVPIVGIGSSAGGLEALQATLASLKGPPPCALVIIQHLSPDYASMTADILTRHTDLHVVRVIEDMVVEAGKVYVIEPNTSLQIEAGILKVSPRDVERPHKTIDVFFESLARQCGSKALVVILSGTGSDGTDGAAAVKNVGGFVIAQTPDTARFDGMPKSAISGGVHDLILAPNEILPRAIAILTGASSVVETDPDALESVLNLLSTRENIDLRNYRSPTIRRRVRRRMALAQLHTIADYVSLLETNEVERNLLVGDLFIGVTSFFRDREAYQAVTPLIEEKLDESNEPFRVWTCGCSTGEEAYSVAILLDVLLSRKGSQRPLQVFGTDISEGSIRHASRGVYTRESIRGVPEGMLGSRFRVNSDGDFVCDEQLRRSVIFSQHDALNDPPFSKLDLVICRNVTIYFEKTAQQQLLETFAFSLKPGGILWLGPSEALADKSEIFSPEDAKWRIYRKSSDKATWVPQLGFKDRGKTESKVNPVGRSSGPNINWRALHDDSSSGYLPSHFMVTRSNQLIYQQGELARSLLKFPEGGMTVDARALVPEELRPALELLLETCRHQGEAQVPSVKLSEPDETLQLHARLSGEVAIIFVARDGEQNTGTNVAATPIALADIDQGLQRRIEILESELQLSQEMVQTTVEELEASNEELQATNEELMASNEELQSVNEELQSVNEELHTINAEHQDKILELGELNRDLDTLLGSIDHGVLFLDGAMKLRRFNPRAQDFVALVRSDTGRPLSHFRHQLDSFALLDHAARVLQEKAPAEHVATTEDGRSVLVRLVPLPSGDDGMVVSFTDITALESLRKSHAAFISALDKVDLPLAVLDCEGKVEYANFALSTLSGRDPRFIRGSLALHLVKPDHEEVWLSAMETAKGGKVWEGYLPIGRPDGQEASEVVRLTPIMNAKGVVTGLVRLSLANVHPGSELPTPSTGSPFFMSRSTHRNNMLASVELIMEQLCEGGDARARALGFVEEEDHLAVLDLLKRGDKNLRSGGDSEVFGTVSFVVRLGQSERFRVEAKLSSAKMALRLIANEVVWRRGET